jgi:hypothetical protein
MASVINMWLQRGLAESLLTISFSAEIFSKNVDYFWRIMPMDYAL